MQDLLQFVPENLLILIMATYVLGIFLKKFEGFQDKYITSVLMLFCITFAVLLNIINSEYKEMLKIAINAVLQGIICWGVAVGINQTYKQLNKE